MGTLAVLVEASPRQWGVVDNQSHFCGGCGHVYKYVATGGRRWQLVYGCCSTCRPEADWWVPGSGWSNYPQINAAQSDAWMREELQLHLDWFTTQWSKYDFPSP